MEKRKIGEGHAAAMGRLGWRELRNAASWESRSVGDTEIGLLGTATQGEITQARGSYGLDAEHEKPQGRESVLGYQLPEQDQPGPEQSQSRGR